MKETTILITSLLVLLLFNISSAFVFVGGNYISTFTYIIRIGLYFFFINHIVTNAYPQEIKQSFLYKFNITVPFLLLVSVAVSLFFDGNLNFIISRIFSTFFLLADNVIFMYLGFTSIGRMNEGHNDIDILWWFATISILLMTCVTIYAKMNYVNLESLWNLVREENGLLDKFLGVYKNSNPYKFAILAGFLYLRKSKYNIWLTLLCFINILIVGKRGPLLAGFLSVVIVFFFTEQGKSKYIKYMLYFVILLVIYYLFVDNSLFETIAYRMDMSQHETRGSDTSFYTSGRNDIWQVMLDGISNSNPLLFFIGNGVLGTYELLTKAGGPGNAHNTWLEVFYNFGIVGFFFFLSYYVNIFKIHREMRQDNFEFSNIFLYIFIFSIISTFYTVTYSGGFVAPGYANLMISYLFGIYMYEISCDEHN